jgi:hypothetical protein
MSCQVLPMRVCAPSFIRPGTVHNFVSSTATLTLIEPYGTLLTMYVELDDFSLQTGPFHGLPLSTLLFEKLEAGPY